MLRYVHPILWRLLLASREDAIWETSTQASVLGASLRYEGGMQGLSWGPSAGSLVLQSPEVPWKALMTVTAPLAADCTAELGPGFCRFMSLDKISVSLHEFSEALKLAEPLLLSCNEDRGKEVSPHQPPCHTPHGRWQGAGSVPRRHRLLLPLAAQ